METLDLRGLRCPLPALRTKRRLARLPAGTMLEVLATDPLSGIDIPHAVREAGGRILERRTDPDSGVEAFVIVAGESGSP